MRVSAVKSKIWFGPDNEKSSPLIYAKESGKIQISSIHDVKAARFWNQFVEDVDIVKLAVADMDEGWDVATQIQKSMQFDGCFGLAKVSPWEYWQAEGDGCRIEGIYGLIEFDSKIVVDV